MTPVISPLSYSHRKYHHWLSTPRGCFNWNRSCVEYVRSSSITTHRATGRSDLLRQDEQCIRRTSKYTLGWTSLYAVAQLVEAQSYKPEGRGFDSRWGHWLNPSGRTMAPGSTQPLTEMSTRDVSWGQKRPVRRADNLTTFMYQLSRNSGRLNLLEP
jgi:hypothetical protein